MITDERLNEIKERVKRASPGPWSPCLGSGNHECTALKVENAEPGKGLICDFLPDYDFRRNPDKQFIDDMRFVQHARDDVPALVAEVEIWRNHAAESDREFNQIEDWLIGNQDFDLKTGLIDRAAKCKERIRDLVAKEGELGDLKAEVKCTICIFCKHKVQRDPKNMPELMQHIMTCSKNPVVLYSIACAKVNVDAEKILMQCLAMLGLAFAPEYHEKCKEITNLISDWLQLSADVASIPEAVATAAQKILAESMAQTPPACAPESPEPHPDGQSCSAEQATQPSGGSETNQSP